MLKSVFIFFCIVVVTKASSSPTSDTNRMKSVMDELNKCVKATLSPTTASVKPRGFFEDIETAFDRGLFLPTPLGTLKLGFISVPFEVLNNIPGVRVLGCHICNQDCVVVHNRYGGTVRSDPRAGQEGRIICYCDDDRPENKIVLTAAERCGPLAVTDGLTDNVILPNVLEIRESLLQCHPAADKTIDSTGCNADCINNHQYHSGLCAYENAVLLTPEQSQDTNPNQLFCTCSKNTTNNITA